MKRRMTLLLSILGCCALAVWIFVDVAHAEGVVPAGAIPVTCTASSIDDSNDTYLTCVDYGGIDTANDYSSVPSGKYLFVTDINIVPTQVFTTATPAMMRLTRDPVSGSNNIVYEMRITDSNSKHVAFTTPIIRLNAGDRLFAENLTSNSFTNDLRVYVTGWLTDSPDFNPTMVEGAQMQVQQTGMQWLPMVMLTLLVMVTGAQFLQTRHQIVE